MSSHDAQRHGGPDPFEPVTTPEQEDGLFPAPVSPAPTTGDPVIDDALVGLEMSARSGDLDAQAEAGERVHRELQERLDDLGGG